MPKDTSKSKKRPVREVHCNKLLGIETFALNLKRYRDSQGKPACAKNFETGDVCIFYRTQRLGCSETCVFADDMSGSYLSVTMVRRNNGEGSLIPLNTCPIWKDA